MNPRIHQLLLQNDSATDVEYPPGFDWHASMRVVKDLKPEAERILGQPLMLDDQAQDASFFAELFVLEEGAVGSNGVSSMVIKITIRFSTFGKLATIHTNPAGSNLDKYAVPRLAELLEKSGFQYIPADTLAEPYDGKLQGLHQSVGGDATWWDRFFDYM